MKYFTVVIVRLDRTIQNLMKKLDSVLRLDRRIKSENDEHKKFKCLLAGLIEPISKSVMLRRIRHPRVRRSEASEPEANR